MKNREKIALGTAQFGQRYGIANQVGQVPSHHVRDILKLALRAKVTTLDTAISYGESERVLGRHNLRDFSIVTKLPGIPSDCQNIKQWVIDQLIASLARLRVTSLDGLLLHKPSQLLEPFGDELYRVLDGLKQHGLVRRIGISIYAPEELEAFCNHYDFDLVQAPFNVLDRRLIETGWLDRLHSMGIALHARSVFMQGLLLMPQQDRPTQFSRWNSIWERWEKWLESAGQTPVQACLEYALAYPQIERVVVGVDSVVQWKDILSRCDGPISGCPDNLECNDLELLNPANWDAI